MNGVKLTSASLLAAGCLVFAPGLGFSQTSPGSSGRETIHPDISSPNTSTGGTRSERVSPGGVPLPECSNFGGTTGKVRDRNAVENCKDQSQSNQNYRNGSMASTQNSPSDIREAQRQLKEKGYDPGAVDGVMGAQTRQAIRSFQKSNDLAATGRLDDKTAAKLGLDQHDNNSAQSSNK